MDEQAFVNSLENLQGKVAIVTGGSQGIGLQTTIYLARLGATVYVCTLDDEKNRTGVISACEELKKYPDHSGSINFHELDLSSLDSVKTSADELKKKLGGETSDSRRLDIIVGNAAIAMVPQNVLSIDGYERTFAVNCLGHFALIKFLLDIVEETATRYGEARITMTSSWGHKKAVKLDYKALKTIIPEDGSSFSNISGAYQRYLNSKLAVLYFALELDKRLHAQGRNDIFVNACHPGESPKTGLGSNQQPLVGPLIQKTVKNTLGLFMRNSTKDSAKTQVFLSASSKIREQNVHGEYWAQKWSWRGDFVECHKEELVTALAKDEQEWKSLWDFCEEAVANAAML